MVWAISLHCHAQLLKPEVVFQSGFSNNFNSDFLFSSHGKYLVGRNDVGEYILWEVSTGRQIKKLKAPEGTIPQIYYLPAPVFSSDETAILLPDYPLGSFSLYDILSQQITHVFKPGQANKEITHAFFSADGNKILLLEQSSGENRSSELKIYNRDGSLLKRWRMTFPVLFKNPLLLKLLLGRVMKFINNVPGIMSITVNDQLDRIYFSLLNGKVYALNLSPNKAVFNENDYQQLAGMTAFSGTEKLALYKDKLILKGQSQRKWLDSITILQTDTLFIANPMSMRVERKIQSYYICYTQKYRSNTLSTLPIGSNQSLNTRFEVLRKKNADFEITCKDILSGQELFKFSKGSLFNNKSNEAYAGGRLNGGYIVAISPDQQLMAECTREVLVHNLKSKTIKSIIPATRGVMKLAAPLFMDSTRLLIPKTYNDAFVLDMKNGNVGRLKKEIDYQDTAHYGANIHYFYDYSVQIGLENRAKISKDQFITTNFIPNDSTAGIFTKELAVWDSKSLIKKQSYVYQDREFSYHLSALTGQRKKFLVNYKLIDFKNPQSPEVRELKIIKRKDTFFAAKPIFIPKKNLIFSMLGTRIKPGSPNVIFSTWDLNGKLIKSYPYKRYKTKAEFHTLITDIQLSPDSSKVLFCLFDGSAGIFDLETMKVTSNYEHGELLDNSLLGIYIHHSITSACFIDNEHFVTNGDNMSIYLWTIGKSSPDRRVNKQSAYFMNMELSPDKKYLAGIDIDKTVRLINLKTGETDLNFVAFNPDAYAMVNKDGYYASNKKSTSDLSFLFQGRSFEFSQFDLYLNRPDKILETLGYASDSEISYLEQSWQKRLSQLNYQIAPFDNLNDYYAPTVELKGLPDQVNDTQQSLLNFRVAANDAGLPINRLFVDVNGVPLYGVAGLPVRHEKPGLVNIPVSIPLSTGKNRITISVRNRRGVESLQQYLNINYTVIPKKPNLYLISIGAGQYLQKNYNLKYAAKDAREVAALFSKGNQNYNQVFTDTLIDKQVSKANLLRLKSKLKRSQPDDVVILYYAGHGQFDNNQNYFLSTYQNDFKRSSAQGFAYEQIENLLDSIPSRNKIMFIDACYSGEPDKDRLKTTTPALLEKQEKIFSMMKTMFSDLRRSNGVSVITASGPSEPAQEYDYLKNGVFAYFLKKGLNTMESDLNKDGKVSISELSDYLNTQVSAFTEKEQQPTFRNQNVINDMVLWHPIHPR